MDQNLFIENTLQRAKQAGFEAAELYFAEGSSFKTAVHKGEITDYSVSDSINIGFRGLYKGKMGCASTQIMDESSVDMLISAAKTGAELCESDDEQFIYAGDPEYPETDPANPAIAEIPASALIETAKRLEQDIRDYSPLIDSVSHCTVIRMTGSSRMVNSRGLDLRHSHAGLGAYGMPVARRGEITGVGGFQQIVTDPKQFRLDDEIRTAAQEAVDFLDASGIESGKYPILLRSDMAATILSTFANIFSADAAQKGMSLLKGREGEMIASPCVTLIDDPLMKGSLYSCGFDGEGVAAYTKSVIENGTLTTLLHNLKTAKKQGVKTTGNAERVSCAGPMTVAPVNFHFKPSDTAVETLYARAGRALLITDLMGMHSGANAVSGDFSLGAKGYLIENGKIARTVNQITVAGNFLQLLKDIEAVGSDLRFNGEPVGSPTLLIKSLSVAGK